MERANNRNRRAPGAATAKEPEDPYPAAGSWGSGGWKEPRDSAGGAITVKKGGSRFSVAGDGLPSSGRVCLVGEEHRSWNVAGVAAEGRHT